MTISIGGLLLGLVNVAIVVVFLLLIGVGVWFVCTTWVTPLPNEVRRLYIALVALIALYMIIALLFGLPSWHPVSALGNVP